MALLAVPASAAAQNHRFRIGWLVFGDATLEEIDRSLKDALVQHALVDGGNIEISYRYANGAPSRLAELASELVAQKPDMLLAVFLSPRVLRVMWERFSRETDQVIE